MKKTLKVVISILVILVVMCSFVACKDSKTQAPAKENKDIVLQQDGAIIVVADPQYMKMAKDNTLKAYLDVLVEQEYLTYAGEEGSFGVFVKEMNGIVADDKKGEFWMIYSETLTNANEEYSCSYDGKTWYQTNFGISSMPIEANVKYLFIIEKF